MSLLLDFQLGLRHVTVHGVAWIMVDGGASRETLECHFCGAIEVFFLQF